jgi:hypothetical protein
VRRYRECAGRFLFNRRSQRRSVTWDRFHAGIDRLLPCARIIHHLYPGWKPLTGSRMA